MSIQFVEYRGWKRNIRLSNPVVELVVTLDVGPRVVWFGFRGGENLFGEFPEQLGRSGEPLWMLRGGHRLWVAPENKPLTYEPDNEAVDFEEIPDGVRIVQKPGPLSGLTKSLEIRLIPSRAQVRLTHVLTNGNQTPVSCAPWALSVMAPRGLAIIPLPAIVPHDERCAPNQNWSLWSYTDLADPRLKLGSRYVLLRQDPGRGAIKLGLAQKEGWVAYWLDGRLFVKRFEHQAEAVYPDGNVNFEVYADERILELETLAPLTRLEPGQSARHDEFWHAFNHVPECADEREIDRCILPFIQKPGADPE